MCHNRCVMVAAQIHAAYFFYQWFIILRVDVYIATTIMHASVVLVILWTRCFILFDR